MESLLVVQERLAQLDPNNRDHLAEIQGLKTQEAELRSQQQREQAIEEKIQEDIAFSISGVDLSELPPEMIVIVEMIVKADRRRFCAVHALELEQIEDEYATYKAETDMRIGNQDKALEALRQDYETCARELHEQEIETVRLVGERDDYKGKLANAVVQIDEKDAEISRLKSEISDYQKAKVFGEREAQSIIEVNTTEADDINKAIAKAKETWEEKANRGLARWDLPTIETPALEEVLQFQDEAAAIEPSGDQLHIPEAVETVEDGNQFPEAGHDMALPTPGVEETVSRQEFETLKNDVEALKRKAGWAA